MTFHYKIKLKTKKTTENIEVSSSSIYIQKYVCMSIKFHYSLLKTEDLPGRQTNEDL